MIGFFPDPYPDELLYSVCARYAQRTSYPNKRDILPELFGKIGVSAVLGFPTRLEKLVSVLPQGHHYSADKLMDENTLLPFHEPFLPAERIKIIRDDMRGFGNNHLHTKLGTIVGQIENPKFIRYCPDCVKDDYYQYGETYWHRIHQLGGISVCPTHKCFIENSLIEVGRFSAKLFHIAKDFIPKTSQKTRYLNLKNDSHLIILKLAEDAEWLLSNTNLKINNEIICNRYYNILLEQGFAYYNRRIRHTKFVNACQEFFPDGLFALVGQISKRDKWLASLAQSSLSHKTYYPTRHLLLMTFLGLTAKQFFTDFVEFKPFGDAPYPCLNKASDHYQDLRIQKCSVFDNLTKNDNHRGPIAIFECDCGFIYQRLGPDKSEDDKFRFRSVREYGKVWENKFTELWADLSISSAEIGRQLGTSQTSVGRHGIRLKLPMNTPQTRSLEGYKRHRNPKISFSEMLQNYRKQWLQVLAKNPNLTRLELVNTKNFLYLWLKRNDSEWFEDTLPKIFIPNAKWKRLDWEQIDIELSITIKHICQNILVSKSFPVRVSISEIVRRGGKKRWIERRQLNLPLTKKILDKYLESWEDFMLRKLKWTKLYYIKKRELPSHTNLLKKAVIKNLTSDNSPKVQAAIQNTLIEIENTIYP